MSGTTPGASTSTSSPGSPSSALGHCHPAPLAAAHAQLERLWHASNLYCTRADGEGSRRSSRSASAARRRSSATRAPRRSRPRSSTRARRPGKHGVVALEGGFHGRTLGALSVTGQPAKRAAFAPLVPGVRFVPPNDIEALEAAVDERGRRSILLEPILGEGGVVPLDADFVRGRREIAASRRRSSASTRCRPGVGRTGTFFAFEQLGVRARSRDARQGTRQRPADRRAARRRRRRRRASCRATTRSTFGGNPVACAAACAVVDAVDDELLAQRAGRSGRRLATRCAAIPRRARGARPRPARSASTLDRPVARGRGHLPRARAPRPHRRRPTCCDSTPPLVIGRGGRGGARYRRRSPLLGSILC